MLCAGSIMVLLGLSSASCFFCVMDFGGYISLIQDVILFTPL
jgi:hypothetical protein